MSQALARQFGSFLLAGGIATTAHYALLVILVRYVDAPPVGASMAGYLVGAIIAYTLNYTYTFRSRKKHRETFFKFLAVAGIGFILNASIMALFTIAIGLHYLLSQFIATLAVLLWNFTANRLWTFRENAHVKR